jgi:hypothetical protein
LAVAYILPVLLCLAFPACAGETLEQKVGNHLDGKPPQRFLTITEENDKYGSGTDRNYTNGTRITWFDTGAHPPAFVRNLLNGLPGLTIGDTTAVYYALGQSMFTPEDKTRRDPDPKDRPYAGFLYGTMGLASVSGNHVDNLGLTLGVVGPLSFAEQTQKFVHTVVGAKHAKGWDHQLKNEPGLDLSWQRLWPEAQAFDEAGFRFRLSPYTGAALGNVYTYGSAGVMFQIVPEKYSWQSNPIRVQPAMPGDGYFDVPDRRFAWSLFFGLEGRAVARNIFLDGNSFADSRSVDKNYFVGDANAGISLTYGRVQISYTLNWRSEEFRGQGGGELFGALSAGYRF